MRSSPHQTSLVAQTVKHLPMMQETRVQFLGGEDPLEKEIATHSSTLAWKIPWMEEPGGLQSMGLQSRTRLSDFPFLPLPSTSVGLNHPIPLSSYIRAGQLDCSWLSRFYNTQLAPGKLTIVFELWGRATGRFLVPDQKTASCTRVQSELPGK